MEYDLRINQIHRNIQMKIHLLCFLENEQPQVQDFADDMTAEMLASSEVGGEIESSESSESSEGEYIHTCTMYIAKGQIYLNTI